MKNSTVTTLRAKTVLCVEDNGDTCELIKILLAGYDVVVSGGVTDALRLFAPGKFDLCILDNWLPDGSGIELCKTIRAADPLVPIVFSSGVASRAEIQKALTAGARVYLVKPYEPEQLQKIVKDLIGE